MYICKEFNQEFSKITINVNKQELFLKNMIDTINEENK